MFVSVTFWDGERQRRKKKLWVQGLCSETEDDRCRPRSLLNDSNDHFSVKWWWSNEGNHVFGSTIRGFFLRISLGIYRPGRLSHSEFRFRVPVPLRFGMANTKEKKSCGFSGCVRPKLSGSSRHDKNIVFTMSCLPFETWKKFPGGQVSSHGRVQSDHSWGKLPIYTFPSRNSNCGSFPAKK